MNGRLVFAVGLILLNLLAIYLIYDRIGAFTPHGINDTPNFDHNTASFDANEAAEFYYRMAKRHGTDKVTTHAYQHLYGLFLGPIRTRNFTLIEIGLGCDMNYGPGKSLGLWREYTPNAQVHVLEYDAACAQKYESQMDKVYTGDQSDFSLLKIIATENEYDVIIDDGGHTRKQQIHSLIGLWPALKSKGVYIIEDMFTTLQQNTHYAKDLSISTVKVMEYFIYRFNNVKLPLNIYQEELDNIYSSLLSVNCFREACVLIKK